MTGTLQIKRERYYCVLDYKDENGKRKLKWISTGLAVKGNKRKATEFLNKIMTEYEQKETQSNSEDILFTDYLQQWLEKKKNKVELTTWEGYRSSTINHLIPYFEKLNLKINQLKPKHFVDYYDYKSSKGRLDGKNGGLSTKSIKEHSVVIKNALNNAVIEELINKNPALHVPLPKNKEKKQQLFLNATQANKLLELFKNHQLQPLIYLTLYYGLRRGEVLGLKWSAIDFKNDKVKINHTVVKHTTVIAKDKTKTEASKRE